MDGEDASSYYDIGNDLGEAGPYVIQESDDASNFKKDTTSSSGTKRDCGGSGRNEPSSHTPPFNPWGGASPVAIGGALVTPQGVVGTFLVGRPSLGWFRGQRGGLEETPDTDRSKFTGLKNGQGFRHKKTGKIWRESYTSHRGDKWKKYDRTNTRREGSYTSGGQRVGD
ncbi:MAG: hypothetical protein HYS07_06165 [Chlamydiae bacterium]|nr:hypothetical protein [Chlamydiota bacterium]MBI3276277.1 hypothetical protein [Chlamydiota bacterium]